MRLVAAIAAAVVAGSSAGATTIINGSFEQGAAITGGGFITVPTGDSTSITGWTVLSDGVDYIGTYWQASDGDRSLDMSAMTSGGVMQSVAGFEVGKRYRLTFDLSANSGGALGTKTALVSATGGGAEIFEYELTAANSTTNMAYQSYTYEFTASGTSQDIQFRSQVFDPYGVVLDNVAISLVPEPAAWTLLIAGFAMTGVAMRRRKVAVAA